MSFILNAEVALPDPQLVIASAVKMGFKLKVIKEDDSTPSKDDEPGVLSFSIGDDTEQSLLIGLMPAPHPDVAEMSQGPLSPDDIDALINAPAHYVVTVIGMDDSEENDIRMAGLTAAVLDGCNPVGVLKMPGIIFHRPGLFADMAKLGVESKELPAMICVDVTVAMESDSVVSFLTHNMERYGRENIFVKASTEGEGSVEFVFDIMNWLLEDREYTLPTGDTIGRDENEKIKIQRVANPTGEGPQVILLEI